MTLLIIGFLHIKGEINSEYHMEVIDMKFRIVLIIRKSLTSSKKNYVMYRKCTYSTIILLHKWILCLFDPLGYRSIVNTTIWSLLILFSQSLKVDIATTTTTIVEWFTTFHRQSWHYMLRWWKKGRFFQLQWKLLWAKFQQSLHIG